MASLSTMIVDLLRGRTEEEILNRGGPIAKSAPRKTEPKVIPREGVSGIIPNRAYQLYKAEAEANGESVMSPAEFKRAQSEGRR